MNDIYSLGVFEAKTRFSELAELASTGKEILVTKRGKAIAMIVPPKSSAPSMSSILDSFRAIRSKALPGPSIREMIDEGRP